MPADFVRKRPGELIVAALMTLAAVSSAHLQTPAPPQAPSALEAPRPIEAGDSLWTEELTWMEVRDAVRAGNTTVLIGTATEPTMAAASALRSVAERPVVSPSATAFSHRSILAPLAPERYLLKVTLSRDAHDRLERARALLRHAIPNGDPAAVVERALTALIEQLEKRKIAATSRPRRHPSPASRTRHVPAAVKRAVWARDQGQCAFVGAHGRCEEAAFLEFHHVRPFAVGGRAEAPAGAKAGAQRL